MQSRPNTIAFAFRKSIPILLGYLVLGMAFGLLLQKAGYNALWAGAISTFVYAGSMQFALVGLLADKIDFLSLILLTIAINSRHIFYGLSFLTRFRAMGKRYPYMVFSLTDETYSLLYGTSIPEGLDPPRTMFTISLLDHCYWIAGSIAGSLVGKSLPFDTTGIDFAMTALFLVILVEQWKGQSDHRAPVIGLATGAVGLIVFGPDMFLLPALVASFIILFFLQGKNR